MVGASGAISGVMGAYLVLYPKVRVHLLVFLGFFVTTVAVPAYFMLAYWALLQALGSVPSLSGGGSGGGVAFMAHLGGFVAGLGGRDITKQTIREVFERLSGDEAECQFIGLKAAEEIPTALVQA